MHYWVRTTLKLYNRTRVSALQMLNDASQITLFELWETCTELLLLNVIGKKYKIAQIFCSNSTLNAMTTSQLPWSAALSSTLKTAPGALRLTLLPQLWCMTDRGLHQVSVMTHREALKQSYAIEVLWAIVILQLPRDIPLPNAVYWTQIKWKCNGLCVELYCALF